MTNKDYLLSQLGFIPANPLTLQGAIIDVGVIDSDPYVSANSITLKTAAVAVIKVLLSTADTDMGADLTRAQIKYDRTAVLARLKMLEIELGLTDAVPTITGRSAW